MNNKEIVEASGFDSYIGEMKLNGMIDEPVRVGCGKTIRQRIYVSPKVGRNLIQGGEWLKKSKASMSFDAPPLLRLDGEEITTEMKI